VNTATTDPQDELFEILDPDGSPTGRSLPRWRVHREGHWHGALHIWVAGVRPDGSEFVLFQRRSMSKDTWPGYLDVAIGGHVRAGESLAETVREAEEEIGLRVELADLIRIGRRFASGSGNALLDNEIQEVFGVRSDAPLEAYAQHPEEVSALVMCSVTDARVLLSGAIDSIAAWECPRGALAQPVRLRSEDFVPTKGEYALEALTRLPAVLRGESVEPFQIRV
jgi:isopentenyldiphosphate isomerase